jgi:hypothetical protein
MGGGPPSQPATLMRRPTHPVSAAPRRQVGRTGPENYRGVAAGVWRELRKPPGGFK